MMPRTNRILTVLVLLGGVWLLLGSGSGMLADETSEDTPAVREGPILLPIKPAYRNQSTGDPAPAADTEPAQPPLGSAEKNEEDASQDDQQQSEPEVAAEPKPPLSQAMAALRDRVRHTLAVYHRPVLSTRDNTATEVMHLCLAFGCNSELSHSGSPGGKLNGITCLCWNYPCAGYRPLGPAAGRIAARIGYGLQERPAQLLAVLALSRVPATYPIRLGGDERTVADLVEHEKLSCRSATDLSGSLIGLAYYIPADATWQNGLDEEWSVARIIKEEIAKPVVNDGTLGTERLMGLSFAVDRRTKRKKPIDGEFRRAKSYVEKFHDYALSLQNADGSWGPQLLAARGSSRDTSTQLRATGHVLRWLAFSLPEEELGDARVVRSVEYVNRLLGGSRYRSSVKSLSTRDIESVMHALHALMIYDQRYFKPRTPTQPAPEPTARTAKRP